jgi:hypothetical protein
MAVERVPAFSEGQMMRGRSGRELDQEKPIPEFIWHTPVKRAMHGRAQKNAITVSFC